MSSTERLVRINSLATGLAEDDIIAIAPSHSLSGIVIPKVKKPEDVYYVLKLLHKYGPSETASKTRIIASIESAYALMHIKEVKYYSGTSLYHF